MSEKDRLKAYRHVLKNLEPELANDIKELTRCASALYGLTEADALLMVGDIGVFVTKHTQE